MGEPIQVPKLIGTEPDNLFPDKFNVTKSLK